MAPPLTWIEALSAGLPIITTRSQGIEELLTNGKSSLIFDDWQSLEAALMETDFSDKVRLLRLGAWNEFHNKYSLEIVSTKYMDVYRRILNI